MSEQPDRMEQLLRGAMRAHVEGAFPAPGVARRALRDAARGRRVQYAATAAASVAAVGVVTATTVVVHDATHGGGAAATLGSGSPSPTGSCFDTASPTPVASSVMATEVPTTSPSSGSAQPTFSASAPPPNAVYTELPAAQSASAQIRGVSLANPAPGYPLRRGEDSLDPTGFGPSATFWTATYLVAQTPSAQRTLDGGGTETDPTGPEATVLVIDGHPFNLDNPTTIEGLPVSETTTVLGHQAWVTSACDQTDIVFSTGRFQVLLAGFPGGDDAVRDTNVARLKVLAGALQGLQ